MAVLSAQFWYKIKKVDFQKKTPKVWESGQGIIVYTIAILKTSSNLES